ncbi:tRNA pseudouridine(54/55) synthase, variant 5 [Aphanomyces invadans]|uniref:tRNA pseudouridine(55) synthase n=1 Tax=Aphanomyces invadans TaxID=157072 RepID=A0A024UHM5_9STRA|nr:tRNA pseudouridine(54/55) synthase, variant 5 [Aphanomyces invadans]ETW05367.1 tRNA pseudouridine(54/55) synthase, variant 5 [Aphanomyces invadans]|eukprot:XP_008866806.1 tRNA pseudouridine(54/55) synthase, variant 5 [Aphanomyces invadans]
MAANATLLGLLPAGSFEKLHALKSLGVCVRCILRYAAVTDHELYSLDSAELSATWDTFSAAQGQPVPDAPAAIAGVCTCCLDVFEGALGASNRADLVAKAKDCGYATTTFMIAIQIPSATLIRQHSLSHHVKFPSTPIDLKEVLKWCLTPILATALNNATYVATSDVSIHLHFQHELSEQEAMQVPTIRDTIMQNKRRKLEIDAFGAVTRALQSMHDFPSTMPCPPTVAKTPCSLTVKMERAPTYVAGRYLKYQRGLSQTPWVLDGERLGESSVEEAIGDIVLPHFHAKSYKFHTAGREDVDVRMLGNGRPFILELIGTMRQPRLRRAHGGCRRQGGRAPVARALRKDTGRSERNECRPRRDSRLSTHGQGGFAIDADRPGIDRGRNGSRSCKLAPTRSGKRTAVSYGSLRSSRRTAWRLSTRSRTWPSRKKRLCGCSTAARC